MLISNVINDKIILPTIDNKTHLKDKNMAVGIVQGSNNIANGLILAGALSGDGSIVTTLAFWSLGQVALVLGCVLYSAITPYNVLYEIQRGNTAAALGLSGVLIGLGNIVGFASRGDFISWFHNLSMFAVLFLWGITIMWVFRWVTDKIYLHKGDLSREIVDDKNVGFGLVEAAAYLAGSIIVTGIS